ncbi:HDOD domain-containing protein [Desulfovibrio aerotolerans]|uniref:HDOD domain-containing protein n=1 Tax=Solidesulfovibrio aerotolerans TaxID=295255 RepID=A0A7C9N0G3_9BACT|nr:HDOD domain-containing protein [Solidesulfovibrio aerotolerans]MYL82331.1 HDOD domain-containing protein [Solidesulfovibrio aerotolerans]
MDFILELDFLSTASVLLMLLLPCTFLIHYAYKQKLTHRNRLFVHASSQASVVDTGICTQEILSHPNGEIHAFSEQFVATLTRNDKHSDYDESCSAAGDLSVFPIDKLDNVELRSIFTDATSLITEINNNHGSITRIAELIGSDPILCLRVINVANTAFYAAANKSNSIKYAVSRLGVEALKAIVVKELLAAKLKGTDATQDTLHQLVRHSAYCASCASYFAAISPELDPSILYTAGLFHDIGKCIILTTAQEQQTACLRPYVATDSRRNDTLLWHYEHAAVGASTLARWDIDSLLCTLTRSHHLPAAASAQAHHGDSTLAKYLSVLYIANQFAKYFDQTSKPFIEPIAWQLHPAIPFNAIRALLANSNMLMDLTRIHYLLKI